MILPSILLFFLFYKSTSGFGLHGFHFRGLEEPGNLKRDQSHDIVEKWIEQPLDHFNPRDGSVWSMRYMENADLFKKNGPIFIMIGGEWSISRGYLEGGLMYELGKKHNAMMYYTEHRYYGKSRPTEDTSPENLQYLNVDQALADLAYFIDTKKKEESLRDSIVIVFGGSYAGNMAAWARLKYPHLIQGGLASSAPVFAKADFFEYYEIVTKSLARYSRKCTEDIKAAFEAVEELLVTKGGPEQLKTYFNLCSLPDVKSASDIGYLMNLLAEHFAGVVQYDKVEDGRTKIAVSCDQMTAAYLGSPLQRLAHLISNDEACMENNYQEFLQKYRNASWESPGSQGIMRQWYYQTCTEYGYYQTTNSEKSVFGTLFPLSYFTKLCVDLYDELHMGDYLHSRVKRTNIMYGGVSPDLEKIIFTNGDIDPWHPLSVLSDLNEFSPSIFINGSSHCRDLQSDFDTDAEDLIKARARIRKIIGNWVGKE